MDRRNSLRRRPGGREDCNCFGCKLEKDTQQNFALIPKAVLEVTNVGRKLSEVSAEEACSPCRLAVMLVLLTSIGLCVRQSASAAVESQEYAQAWEKEQRQAQALH